jgi:maltose-binding protein MalE
MRWLTLLLSLLGALPSQAAPERGTILLWHSYRAVERRALEEAVRQWNAGARGRDPEIKLQAVPYDAFPDKITAAIPRGHGPDLFVYPGHDRVGDWAESKIIEPIEFWMTEKHADKFLFKAIDALCYGDSLYGLPMAFKSTALYYNKALIARPPRSTDELIALGRKHTDRARGRFGLVYDNNKLYFHAPWLFGFGGGIFDGKGKLIVNSAAAVKALAFARQLGGPGGIVAPEPSTTLTTTLFNQGKAAMAISGPWMLGEIDTRRVQVGVAPLPKVSATGRYASPFLGAEAIMMSARCKQKDAAFRAMRFLTSDGVAIQRALNARQPVANHAAWKDPRVRKDPVLAAFRRQLDTATVMPGTPQMRLVWSPYDMALQKVMSGRATPARALAEAEREIRRYLAAMSKTRRGARR